MAVVYCFVLLSLAQPEDDWHSIPRNPLHEGNDFHDLQRKELECPLHGDRLQSEIQDAFVGKFYASYPPEFYEAEQRLFPYEPRYTFVPDSPGKVKVMFCPSCRRAKADWAVLSDEQRRNWYECVAEKPAPLEFLPLTLADVLKVVAWLLAFVFAISANYWCERWFGAPYR